MQEHILDPIFEKHLLSGDIALIKAYIHMHPSILAEDKANLLHAAVKSGKLEIVLLVLNRFKVNVNALFKEKTALHLAVKMNAVEIALTLLYAGANVNLTDKQGYSVLHYALSYQSDEIMGLLFTGKLPNERHLVIWKNKLLDSVNVQLTKDKSLLLYPNVDLQSKTGVTPLMIAIATGRVDYLQMLFNLDININCATAGAEKLAPIHFAISAGNPECLELLLSKGARFNGFKGETPTALEYLAIRWKAAPLEGLKECAEMLLFHGAGVGVQLPTELIEMGLTANRCCLFNSRMKIKSENVDDNIDVNLQNQYPLAIHTLADLLADHKAFLGQHPLPYRHLLNCVDFQLGLYGQDSSIEVKNLYHIRYALYRVAPKTHGGMSLSTVVLVNAKRNGTLVPLLTLCLEKPELVNYIKEDLMELMQLPNLQLPLISLETERAQLLRVTDFHNNLQLLQQRRIRRVCFSGDECCWPWWTFGSITAVALIAFTVLWILLDTSGRDLDYGWFDFDNDDNEYSCWQWVFGGKKYLDINHNRDGFCTAGLNNFNLCYHDILCKTAIGGTSGAVGLSLLFATFFIVGCIYSKRLSSQDRRELTELERIKNYYETGLELAEIPERTSIKLAVNTSGNLMTFWQQRCEQTEQRDLITEGRRNFFINWMRGQEEQVVDFVDEVYSSNSDNELENLV